jgi:hypothetical protein
MGDRYLTTCNGRTGRIESLPTQRTGRTLGDRQLREHKENQDRQGQNPGVLSETISSGRRFQARLESLHSFPPEHGKTKVARAK